MRQRAKSGWHEYPVMVPEDGVKEDVALELVMWRQRAELAEARVRGLLSENTRLRKLLPPEAKK